MAKASTPTAALPNYTIRESDRAKNVSLRISVQGGLEVVVPRGYDYRHVPEIVRQKQGWIDRSIQRVAEQRHLYKHDDSVLPHTIDLQAIHETWQVIYQSAAQDRLTIAEHPGHHLLLRGSISDTTACRAALCCWLRHRAERAFAPWLRQVSQELQLPFNQVTVRGQKTLWGSCSSKCNISLNYKLLFLPAPLVRYVFVHELCHTLHMNHSSQFWRLVGEKDPAYKHLDQELHKASYYVPTWLDTSS